MLRKSFLFFCLCLLCWGILLPSRPEAKKLNITFSERFRFVSWDNSIDLNNSTSSTFSFTRHRTSLGLTYSSSEKFVFSVRFTNEFRNYLSPGNREFNLNEVFFDLFNARFQKIFNLPVSLTIGRQNIMLGEGFVCFDGQPLTGSRSAYFNAVRADLEFKKDQKLTFFISYTPTEDNLLPLINNQNQALIERSSTGIGIYYSGKILKGGLEVYYLRKNSGENENYPLRSGVNTFGARFSLPLAEKLGLTAETAFQTGYSGNQDQRSWGGYFHLDYQTSHLLSWLSSVTGGAIFLSGDNGSTSTNEAWDPVFARWPKWSESYIYTQIKESRVAYWSNLNSLYLRISFSPFKTTSLNFSTHLLGAAQAPTPGDFPGGSGKTRGLLIIGRLNFKINRYLNGHLVWENFNPGNFYFPGADSYNWLRFELMFRL